MQKRLIELLYEAEGQVNNDLPSLEQIADYLIEHGVIVPPCKVGDVVCIIGHVTKQKVHDTINKIIYDGNDIYLWLRSGYVVYPEQIGETVFLSEAEAEKALAERR